MAEKKLKFVNKTALNCYLALPKDVQKQFGLDLHAVQKGENPFSKSKDVSGSVGDGAIELIWNGSPAYRAIYCVKCDDMVWVLHAFTKTTNGVDQANMNTAAKRYKDMKAEIEKAKKAAKAAAKKKR